MIYESLHRKYEHSVPDYTKIVTRFQDFPLYKKKIGTRVLSGVKPLG